MWKPRAGPTCLFLTGLVYRNICAGVGVGDVRVTTEWSTQWFSCRTRRNRAYWLFCIHRSVTWSWFLISLACHTWSSLKKNDRVQEYLKFSNWFPFGVGCHGWTTYTLYGGSFYGYNVILDNGCSVSFCGRKEVATLYISNYISFSNIFSLWQPFFILLVLCSSVFMKHSYNSF